MATNNDQPTKMWSGRFREPLNRTTRRALLALLLSQTNSFGQQPAPTSTSVQNIAATPAALVTFYSNSMSLEGGFPKQKGAAFKGRLFSDGDQIAFMEPGQFFTISLVPGHYTFTANAWALKTPTGGAHLQLDAVAGEHYFVETGSRTVPFPSYFSIKKVTCSQALKDNAKDKPLEPKHVSESAAPFVVAEISFPTCP